MNRQVRTIVIGLTVLAGGSFVAYQVLKQRDPPRPVAADVSGSGGIEVQQLPKFREPVEIQPTNATGTYTVPTSSSPDRPRPAAR